MNDTKGTVKPGYQCPLCGNVLPRMITSVPFATPCCECGCYLWCRRRDSTDGVLLEAVSGRAPEPWELGKVVRAIAWEGPHARVTVDLSKLETINCSFLAALVRMKRRLEASGCTLVLCGLNSIVAQVFDRLRLNRLFDIVASEQHDGMCA